MFFSIFLHVCLILIITQAIRVDYSNWQTFLDDDELLGNIVLPGTQFSASPEMQNLTVLEQLQAGVRFFHLPLQPGSVSNFCDTSSNEDEFQILFDVFPDFLHKHNQEFILVIFVKEPTLPRRIQSFIPNVSHFLVRDLRGKIIYVRDLRCQQEDSCTNNRTLLKHPTQDFFLFLSTTAATFAFSHNIVVFEFYKDWMTPIILARNKLMYDFMSDWTATFLIFLVSQLIIAKKRGCSIVVSLMAKIVPYRDFGTFFPSAQDLSWSPMILFFYLFLALQPQGEKHRAKFIGLNILLVGLNIVRFIGFATGKSLLSHPVYCAWSFTTGMLSCETILLLLGFP